MDAVGLEYARTDADDVESREDVDQITSLEHKVHGDGAWLEAQDIAEDAVGELEQGGVALRPRWRFHHLGDGGS